MVVVVVFENNIVVVVVVFKVVAIFVVVPSFSSFHSLKVLMAKRPLKDSKGNNTTEHIQVRV